MNFVNPNTMEDALNRPAVRPHFMACYQTPKLFNVPANRVQDQYKNRVENSYSTEELNKMFLDGKRVDLKNVLKLNNDAVHYPIDFEFQG